jgi:hypothetical protein
VAHVALRDRQCAIQGETILADEMGDDGVAVADRLAVIDNIGAAGRAVLQKRRRRANG